MIKRLIIVLALLAAPLGIGLLFTYDIIKIEWVSFMEIQSSYRPMEDPLPLPPRSVPIQGVAYLPELGVPINPVAAESEFPNPWEKIIRYELCPLSWSYR